MNLNTNHRVSCVFLFSIPLGCKNNQSCVLRVLNYDVAPMILYCKFNMKVWGSAFFCNIVVHLKKKH